MEWEKNASTNNVNETLIHLPRLDEWTGCVATTTDTEVRLARKRQKIFTALYERYLRCVVPGSLNVTWEVVEDAHAAELDNELLGNEDGRAMSESLERIATVTSWVPCSERSHLAVRERYFLKDTEG